MDLDTVDPLTARAVLQIQIRELTNFINNPACTPDERSNLMTVRRDLSKQMQTIRSRCLALRIITDDNSTRASFVKLVDEERQADADHRLASQLALASKDEDIDHQTSIGPARSTADSAPAHGLRIVLGGEQPILECLDITTCNACSEAVSKDDALELVCKPEAHNYCSGCLQSFFRSALTDTTLFPPRCCNLVIPLEACHTFLPKGMIQEIELKVEELATPDPTYCAKRDCSHFIRPKDIRADVGNCVFCGERTCARCKKSNHDGLCPEDPDVQLLMDASEQAKWQQCRMCKNMVELSGGCFHMTCRCRHEFCYRCGSGWKFCGCPKWEEEYIIQDAQLEPQAAGPGPAADADEDPDHEHIWHRLDGGDCQGCHHDLQFVMRCNVCFTQMCWRCINNRA